MCIRDSDCPPAGHSNRRIHCSSFGKRGDSMRLQRVTNQVGLGLIGLVVLLWTILPLYHMLLMSVTPTENLFSSTYLPEELTFENYVMVFTQDHFFLRYFWRQPLNSLFVAIVSVVIVLAVGTMASYVIGRMRPRWGRWVSNAALFTYLIPASFLAIPFY